MVVIPYSMAKAIVDPLQGHAMFDLKDDADRETVNRLNKALNRQDGEEDEEEKPKKKRKLNLGDEPVTPAKSVVSPATTTASTTPVTPSPIPETTTAATPATPLAEKAADKLTTKTPKRKNTKAQVRLQLHKTAAFNPRSKTVIDWEGKEVVGSNIDTILDHAFGATKARHPKGSRELAQRLNKLEITSFSNSAFQALVKGSASTGTKKTRAKTRWTPF